VRLKPQHSSLGSAKQALLRLPASRRSCAARCPHRAGICLPRLRGSRRAPTASWLGFPGL